MLSRLAFCAQFRSPSHTTLRSQALKSLRPPGTSPSSQQALLLTRAPSSVCPSVNYTRLSQRAAGRPCHSFPSTSLKTLHSAPGCCHSAGNSFSRRWGGGGYLLPWEEFNVLPWSAIPGQPVTATEPLLKSHLDSKGNVYPETGAELGTGLCLASGDSFHYTALAGL